MAAEIVTTAVHEDDSNRPPIDECQDGSGEEPLKTQIRKVGVHGFFLVSLG